MTLDLPTGNRFSGVKVVAAGNIGPSELCPKCKGSGYDHDFIEQMEAEGLLVQAHSIPDCPECNGQGRTPVDETSAWAGWLVDRDGAGNLAVFQRHTGVVLTDPAEVRRALMEGCESLNLKKLPGRGWQRD
jgi:RecJ-like exonuclease